MWRFMLPYDWRCRLIGHDPRLMRGRWVCFRCFKDLGSVMKVER